MLLIQSNTLVKKSYKVQILNACRFFPSMRNKQAWELHKEIHKLILDIVKESGEDRNLLSAILHSASCSRVGIAEAENFIVDNCKSIYFAGYESTAVTAAWCLMLLGLHPEWQDRVRAEVHEVCRGRPVDSQSLQKMKNVCSYPILKCSKRHSLDFL